MGAAKNTGKKTEPKTCPYCDENSQPVMPICGACGVTMFTCPSCHKPVERTRKTCPSCGAKITGTGK